MEALLLRAVLVRGISSKITGTHITYIRFEGAFVVGGYSKVSPFLRHFKPVKIRVEIPRLSNAES